jgi:hypothetical protein
MSASDPSGAEMRSPNEVLSAKRIAELVSTLTDPETCDTYDKDALPDDTLAVCASHEALRSRLESEVSPRSSGGAPLSAEQVAEIRDHVGARFTPYQTIVGLCDSHEALRTQVSALRQEAAQAVANARVRRKYIDAAAAARQEAETLTRQRDAAIREISVIAREAETLRGQLDEANSALGTEQTMHRAWRKRAEEAEAELRGGDDLIEGARPLTDDERAALEAFVEARVESDKEAVAKFRRELFERTVGRAARVAAPREPK